MLTYPEGLEVLVVNSESPAQFQNWIKPRLYVRGIMNSTIYEKNSNLLARPGVMKISSDHTHSLFLVGQTVKCLGNT